MAILTLLIPLVTCIVAGFITVRFPRDWEGDLPRRRLYYISAIVVSYIIGCMFILQPFILAAVTTLLPVFLISLYTDIKKRKVRSDIFWIFGIGYAMFYLYTGSFMWWSLENIIVFFCLLAVGCTGFLSQKIGHSDVRAFLLGVWVVYPISGTFGIFIAMCAIIAYTIPLAIYKRSFSFRFPAVPFIVAGFLSSLPASFLIL